MASTFPQYTACLPLTRADYFARMKEAYPSISLKQQQFLFDTVIMQTAGNVLAVAAIRGNTRMVNGLRVVVSSDIAACNVVVVDCFDNEHLLYNPRGLRIVCESGNPVSYCRAQQNFAAG